MPTCTCAVCDEARQKGIPYSRNGNSIYNHDENILFDTPEDIFSSLNRENITSVDHIFLSHKHFDHTLGLRILQSLNLRDKPVRESSGKPITLHVNQETRKTFLNANPSLHHLTDWATIHTYTDQATMNIGDLTITCHTTPITKDGENAMTTYILKDNRTAVISQDETKFLKPSRLPSPHTWIRETGMFHHTPNGERTVSKPIWDEQRKDETTFQETLQQIERLNPDQTILTEIEEIYQRSHDDYKHLAAKHTDKNITFAHDSMEITV